MPKPTVTDEHLQKYEQIMKTGTLNSGAPTLPQTFESQKPQPLQKNKISQLLSSLPKPKAIGNKMFIFNGKKKIIMEGGEKEVENAKTIDATDLKKIQKEDEKKETPKNEEQAPKKDTQIPEKPKEKAQSKNNSNPNMKVYIAGGIILVLIWTTAWAYFLGFFSLLGL